MNRTASNAGASLIKRLWSAVGTHRVDLLLGLLFLWLVGLYALLMFRDRVPSIGLLVLAGLWLVYALVSGRLSYASPVDSSLLGLLCLLPITLAMSIDLGLSLPKIYGLILGIALFFLVVNFLRGYTHLPLAIGGLILLALGTAALGWLTANWSTGRFSFPAQIQATILSRLPFSFGEGDVGDANLNTIGGALVFFVPLLASLIWDKDGFSRCYLQKVKRRQLLTQFYKLLLMLALGAVLVTLLLTGSRAAFLGCGIGLLGLAVWKDRRFLWLIPIGLLVILLAFLYWGQGDLLEFVNALDTSGETSLRDRVKLWRATLAVIQDFPLTGAGIFTLKPVLGEFYTFPLFLGQKYAYDHAHNLFLAVAYDFGLPGLVLYTSLLSATIFMIHRTFSYGRSILRALLMGLGTGLLAYHGFGFLDTNTLGTKLGAILWLFFGLIAAVYAHKRNFRWQNAAVAAPQLEDDLRKPSWHRINRRLLDILIGLGAWLLISLAAASFVNISVIFSMIAAIAGGVYLGYFVMKRFRVTSSKLKAES